MTRWTARLALAGVSAIAAVVSYFHALAVVRSAGARPPVAFLVPFLADLVILGASAALLEASRNGHQRPGLASASLAAGIAVTVAMNVAAGVAHGLTGALVAGWPALAFILALESLVGMVRRGRPAAALAVRGSVTVPADAESAARIAYEASVLAGNPISQNKLQERFSLTRTQARNVRASLNGQVTADAS